MLCPRCFSEVKIINNAVYCPKCGIYLASDVQEFQKQYPTELLKAQQQSQVKEAKKQKAERYLNIVKKAGKLLLIIAVIGIFLSGIFYAYLHLGSNGYREQVFSNYGFTEKAKWYLRLTTLFSVGEPDNKHLPYNFVHSEYNLGNRTVFVGSENDELAIHEIGHAWWWKLDKDDLTFKKRYTDDFIRMSEETDANFENASLFAASMRLSSFCDCLDDKTINYDSIDANHLYVLTAAFTMGKFKYGELKLPPYMWPYFETMFTGKVKVATCYEMRNCEHIDFDSKEVKEKIKGKIKARE